MDRRTLLASLGGVIAASSAGCLETINDRLDKQSQRQFRLGWLSAANTDTKPHQIDLQVKEDGNIVHQSSHKLQGQDEKGSKGEPQVAVAECTWGNTADDYTIHAKVDGGEWMSRPVHTVDTTGYPHTDCVAAQALYRDGTLEVLLQPGCEDINQLPGRSCPFVKE